MPGVSWSFFSTPFSTSGVFSLGCLQVPKESRGFEKISVVFLFPILSDWPPGLGSLVRSSFIAGDLFGSLFRGIPWLDPHFSFRT